MSSVVTTNTISARWGTVATATSYEVAVVNAANAYLTTPPWKPVGLVDNVTLSGLALQDGQPYRVAVRAVGPAGTSVDTVSNGVAYTFRPPTAVPELAEPEGQGEQEARAAPEGQGEPQGPEARAVAKWRFDNGGHRCHAALRLRCHGRALREVEGGLEIAGISNISARSRSSRDC